LRARAAGFSLIVRLVCRVMALTIVLVVSVIAALVYTLQDSVDTLRDRSLQGQAFDIVRHLTIGNDGSVAADLPQMLATSYAAHPGDVAYAVIDESGKVLASANSDGAALDPFLRHNAPELVGAERADGQGFIYSMPWTVGAKRV